MYFEAFRTSKGAPLSILDANGRVIDKSLLPDLKKEQLVAMLKHMKMVRIIDERMLKMQRQGRMLTFAPNFGQEASQVGSVAALDKEKDWLVPAYRELGAWLYFGYPLKNILYYWSGNEEGSRVPKGLKMTPFCVPLASQCQHAAGIGYAANYRATDEVVISYMGDGSTSQGDFHEALNFAAINNTPNIFVVQNNQWAISTPTTSQTKTKTFAEKGKAYGIRSIVVDGNDIFAVYAATKQAADLARAGKGPSLIECYTYRMGPHTTSDDPRVYRTEEEENTWRKKDPIDRFDKYLVSIGAWSDEKRSAFESEFNEEFKRIFADVENNNDVELAEVFKYTYSEMTAELDRQLADRQQYYADTK